jgi:hypothetical protein
MRTTSGRRVCFRPLPPQASRIHLRRDANLLLFSRAIPRQHRGSLATHPARSTRDGLRVKAAPRRDVALGERASLRCPR